MEIERIKQLLDYDPSTGVFTWKTHNIKGKPAGCPNEQGYVKIRIDRRAFKAHRLAWAHYYGVWPTKDIDHVDGDKGNNAIANLREVTNAENAQNNLLPLGKTASMARGVSWWEPNKRWRARITKDGKQHFLGYFHTKEEAIDAYLRAKKELHPFANIPSILLPQRL